MPKELLTEQVYLPESSGITFAIESNECFSEYSISYLSRSSVIIFPFLSHFKFKGFFPDFTLQKLAKSAPFLIEISGDDVFSNSGASGRYCYQIYVFQHQY